MRSDTWSKPDWRRVHRRRGGAGHGERESPHLDGRTAFHVVNNSAEPAASDGPVITLSILPGGLYRVRIAGTGWHRIFRSTRRHRAELALRPEKFRGLHHLR